MASRDADWSTDAARPRAILDHIAARARASKYREVRTRFAGCNDALLAEAHNRFGVVAPFGGPTSSGMLTLHCPPMHLYALGSFLREHGADTVSIASLDDVPTGKPAVCQARGVLAAIRLPFRSSLRQLRTGSIYGWIIWDLIDDARPDASPVDDHGQRRGAGPVDCRRCTTRRQGSLCCTSGWSASPAR